MLKKLLSPPRGYVCTLLSPLRVYFKVYCPPPPTNGVHFKFIVSTQDFISPHKYVCTHDGQVASVEVDVICSQFRGLSNS